MSPSAGTASNSCFSALPGDTALSNLTLSGTPHGSGAEPRPSENHAAEPGQTRGVHNCFRASAVGHELPWGQVSTDQSDLAPSTRVEARVGAARMEVAPSTALGEQVFADELASAAHEVPEDASPIFVTSVSLPSTI